MSAEEHELTLYNLLCWGSPERQGNTLGLGRALRERRLEVGLTLSEFGFQAGISASRLRRIENGKSVPSIDRLLRMGRLLGIDESQLFSLITKSLAEEIATTERTAQAIIETVCSDIRSS